MSERQRLKAIMATGDFIDAVIFHGPKGYFVDYMEAFTNGDRNLFASSPSYSNPRSAFDFFVSTVVILRDKLKTIIDHYDNPAGTPFVNYEEQYGLILRGAAKAPIAVDGEIVL